MKLFALLFVGIFTLHFVQRIEAIPFEEDVTLTMEEKRALDKFQQGMKGRLPHKYMESEIYLVKWLRLAKLDVDQAQTYLQEHLNWRKEMKIDGILDEDFSQMADLFPMDLEGEDYTGRPVLVADASEWDVRRGVLSGLRDEVSRYVIRGIETQCKKIRDKQAAGQNVTRMQVIIDLKGYNPIQHGCLNCISVYFNFLRNFLYQYPLMTDSLIFVNTPQIFEIIVDALSFRRGRFTNNIKIFGNNRNEWQKYLFSIIDPKELPIFLGGRRSTSANDF